MRMLSYADIIPLSASSRLCRTSRVWTSAVGLSST